MWFTTFCLACRHTYHELACNFSPSLTPQKSCKLCLNLCQMTEPFESYQSSSQWSCISGLSLGVAASSRQTRGSVHIVRTVSSVAERRFDADATTYQHLRTLLHIRVLVILAFLCFGDYLCFLGRKWGGDLTFLCKDFIYLVCSEKEIKDCLLLVCWTDWWCVMNVCCLLGFNVALKHLRSYRDDACF